MEKWCFILAESPNIPLHVSFQAHWAASDKNKSKGEARSGSVDSSDRDQIPNQAMGFLRRGYLNRTLLWLIGDRVTPWTSELYLSLESDAEGQRDEMLKGWNVIPAASLPPFSPSWLWYKSAGPAHVASFYVHSADHEFRNLQLNWCLFCTDSLEIKHFNNIAALLVQALETSTHCPTSLWKFAYFASSMFLNKDNIFSVVNHFSLSSLIVALLLWGFVLGFFWVF